jgi:serine/threonine-protein kinase HipA
VSDFVDNLLPDSPEVRERWATDIGLDTTEPFFLLRAYGDDVAGAASFRSPGATARNERRRIGDDAVAERIRNLRSDETAWHNENAPPDGQFSLGGAQRKFSLARHEGNWYETLGADPSTHLFKPQVTGVRDGELVEYLVMRAAASLGIPAANVELFEHGGEHSLVVERFDRRVEAGGVVRLHQEDVLQALGMPRLRKYEKNGGPGIDRVARLLAEEADPSSLERYAATLIFAWIVISTDGHAKNNSLFIQADGALLTPLYDASSVVPYLASDSDIDVESLLNRAAERQMALRYGASNLVGDVTAFELGRIASRCGLSDEDLMALTASFLVSISDAISDAASAMPTGLQTDVVGRTVEWMPIRARQAARAVGLAGLFD